MKPKSFAELFEEAERHEDYEVGGAILEITESVVREMERQGISRTELARRLGASPAYVTKILRGTANFTLATMVRLARALGAELHVQFSPRAKQPALQPSGGGAGSRRNVRASESAGRGSDAGTDTVPLAARPR
jgi:transcriptional regulator with XRE-family HTH domain